MDVRNHGWISQCPCTVTLSNGAVTFFPHFGIERTILSKLVKMALLAVAVVDGPGVSLSAASSVSPPLADGLDGGKKPACQTAISILNGFTWSSCPKISYCRELVFNLRG